MPFVKLGSEKKKKNSPSVGDGVARVVHPCPTDGEIVGATFPMADLIIKSQAPISPSTNKEIVKHNVGIGSPISCSLKLKLPTA